MTNMGTLVLPGLFSSYSPKNAQHSCISLGLYFLVFLLLCPFLCHAIFVPCLYIFLLCLLLCLFSAVPFFFDFCLAFIFFVLPLTEPFFCAFAVPFFHCAFFLPCLFVWILPCLFDHAFFLCLLLCLFFFVPLCFAATLFFALKFAVPLFFLLLASHNFSHAMPYHPLHRDMPFAMPYHYFFSCF